MANRDLNFDPTITSVTPETPEAPTLADDAGQLAEKAAVMSASGKALAATATTQTAFRQLDSQFRLQNADNPTDPKAIQQLQQARQAVVDGQSQNVPAISMRDYTNKTIELGTQSDDLNAAWATKQQIRNSVNSLQTGRVTYLDQANQAGQQFAQSPDADVASALNYQQALTAMHQFSDPILGADKTGAFLKDFNTDYVKSFVAGVAQTSPQRAAALLQDPGISEHFTTQDIGDMAQVIQKTQKQQDLIQSLQVTKSNADLSDVVNDPNASYYQKRAAIDRMDMQGAVTPKAAAAARRVLTSSTDLDAQTDTPTMADIINKTYDLNASATTSPDDYLTGVKDIQQQVLDMQASNQLTAQDAKKLNNQITNLTQAKLSAATNSAGDEFYGANQQFNALPPEFRGQATRALFYASHGQNMTDTQLSTQANQIIDQINTQRRQKALQTVNQATLSDSDFVSKIGVTQDMVNHTAQKYGITPQQVIQQLRSQSQAAKVRPSAPKSAPDTPDEGTAVGSTKAKEPVGILLPGTEDEDTTSQ